MGETDSPAFVGDEKGREIIIFPKTINCDTFIFSQKTSKVVLDLTIWVKLPRKPSLGMKGVADMERNKYFLETYSL